MSAIGIASHVVEGRDRDWTFRVWSTVIVLGYVLSFALLAVSASRRLTWILVIIAAGFLLAASIGLSVFLRQLVSSRLAALRTVIPVAMLVVGLTLIWLWFDSGHDGGLLSAQQTAGWGFFGGCLAIMGVGHLLTVVRQASWLPVTRGAALTAACAAAVGLGVGFLGDGDAGWAGWLAAAGILLSPVGMGLLTEDVVDGLVERGRRPWRRWGPALLATGLAVGVAAAALGVWSLVSVAGIEFEVAVVIAAVLAVVVGAIASNTPSDVVLVAAVLTLVWANLPSEVDPIPVVQPVAGEEVMVALGDSFMSGEGAKRYFQGTNDKGRNECRRAPTAYPAVTASRGGPQGPRQLAFIACSGAFAVHIHQRPQQPEEPLDHPGGGLPQLAHVDWLQTQAKLDVRLVIVSIGGNDALFGDVAQACIAPGDCTQIAARWLDHLDDVAPGVHRSYQRIRDYFGPGVPVLVVPYPIPLRPHRCPSSLLTEREHVFLYGYAIELNKMLRRAASDAGLHFLNEMTGVFEANRLRICDDAAGRVGVNGLAMRSVHGLIEQSLNPQGWFYSSLHPNERGHRAMADVLESWVSRHPDPAVPTDPAPIAEQKPEDVPTLEAIMHDPQFRHCGNDPTIPNCNLATLDWTKAQLIALAQRSIGPILLTAAGFWAIWIWIIWYWRSAKARRHRGSGSR